MRVTAGLGPRFGDPVAIQHRRQGQAGEAEGLSSDGIAALIEQRLEAKKAKNWTEADRIRDELTEAGIVLEDGPEGTTWRRG